MNTTTADLLDELRAAGFTLRFTEGQLLVKPLPDAQTAVRIQEHRDALVALLESASPAIRLGEKEQASLATCFHAFRDRHGHALMSAGWDRAAVFGGLDPLTAKTWNEVPGVAAILLDGWEVTEILPDCLVFRRQPGEMMAWLRSGYFLAEQALEEHEQRRKTA